MPRVFIKPVLYIWCFYYIFKYDLQRGYYSKKKKKNLNFVSYLYRTILTMSLKPYWYLNFFKYIFSNSFPRVREAEKKYLKVTVKDDIILEQKKKTNFWRPCSKHIWQDLFFSWNSLSNSTKPFRKQCFYAKDRYDKCRICRCRI